MDECLAKGHPHSREQKYRRQRHDILPGVDFSEVIAQEVDRLKEALLASFAERFPTRSAGAGARVGKWIPDGFSGWILSKIFINLQSLLRFL